MKKIAVIGLGLIGGSLALAFKKAGYYIIGIPHRQETLDQAKQAGAIDEGSLDLKSVADADFIFICTPISQIIPELKLLAVSPDASVGVNLKPGAVVTDVGSTKYEIVSQAEKLMPKGTFFVGGHPMAGKEKVKFEAAEADLFKDKPYILTATSRTSKKAVESLKEVLIVLGSNIIEIDPKAHDLAVAGISHVPIAIASALVNTVADSGEKELTGKLASSGFRDTTRVASGDPELALDIFSTNKTAVLKLLKTFRNSVLKLEKLIKANDISGIRAELHKAKTFRDSIFK